MVVAVSSFFPLAPAAIVLRLSCLSSRLPLLAAWRHPCGIGVIFIGVVLAAASGSASLFCDLLRFLPAAGQTAALSCRRFSAPRFSAARLGAPLFLGAFG
jgi:hypothetical protein